MVTRTVVVCHLHQQSMGHHAYLTAATASGGSEDQTVSQVLATPHRHRPTHCLHSHANKHKSLMPHGNGATATALRWTPYLTGPTHGQIAFQRPSSPETARLLMKSHCLPRSTWPTSRMSCHVMCSNTIPVERIASRHKCTRTAEPKC